MLSWALEAGRKILTGGAHRLEHWRSGEVYVAEWDPQMGSRPLKASNLRHCLSQKDIWGRRRLGRQKTPKRLSLYHLGGMCVGGSDFCKESCRISMASDEFYLSDDMAVYKSFLRHFMEPLCFRMPFLLCSPNFFYLILPAGRYMPQAGLFLSVFRMPLGDGEGMRPSANLSFPTFCFWRSAGLLQTLF